MSKHVEKKHFYKIIKYTYYIFSLKWPQWCTTSRQAKTVLLSASCNMTRCCSFSRTVLLLLFVNWSVLLPTFLYLNIRIWRCTGGGDSNSMHA